MTRLFWILPQIHDPLDHTLGAALWLSETCTLDNSMGMRMMGTSQILLEFYRDENRCGTPGMETNAAGLSQKCGYEEAAFNCNAVISVYPVTKKKPSAAAFLSHSNDNVE